ncbi:hypothetical protein MA4S0726RB_4102 [Mycobacteroides abscessus 4S-0726-RB]|nr:hypothetical protein MA4S0303_4572 [Mycobacteroides abscessus 4S-0303]EIT92766.1 hypothetical protein MA4S0726RB_4102 [Mycobacteroides abscessus 4S-0726-RB]EIT96314.1 hypothetical protein MA4S0726RA_4511 [Mycobacteroides abscessus 4S-0726-RA]EIV60747.1 hypothetical protein MA4S0116S_3649 [Mycobacteroides abscessus 4S-0116-S]
MGRLSTIRGSFSKSDDKELGGTSVAAVLEVSATARGVSMPCMPPQARNMA